MPDRQTPLPDPPERHQLEPFATVLLHVIVPEALRGGWFEAMESPAKEELARISRRVEAVIEQQLGHALHPAIYVHALQVCTSFYYDSTARTQDILEQDKQTLAVDAAFSLTQSLMLYHNLVGLYVRLS